MSVKVNLVPRDVARRQRANRAYGFVGAGFLGLLVIFGFLYWMQVQRVNDAQDVVDEEQARVAALQADLNALSDYQQLQGRLEDANQLITLALGSEASIAGILQDVAAVMPGDAQLNSLAVSVGSIAEPGLGDVRPSFGAIQLTGLSIRGHAPGLERLLLEFDKIAAFSDIYFSNSTLDPISGQSTFGVSVDLGPEILTGRYLLGIPEELR